jgi:4-nitrophenyl phosphatase
MLDLDGTVYRGTEEVPGAAAFIRQLKTWGIQPLYVTNRANRTPDEVCAHLRGYGVECEEDEVVTSAQATAQYLKAGRVYYVGEQGLHLELEKAGLEIADTDVDHVVVSYDRGLTYDKLKTAARLIDAGATYIATNPDRGLRTEEGIYPGTGAIVAAVSAVVQQDPVIIGKPERLIIDMALQRIGCAPEHALMVGDNHLTDIPAAARASVRSVLILTGISTREDLPFAEHQPDWIVEDFAELTSLVERVRA